jgi:hypothetical protein
MLQSDFGANPAYETWRQSLLDKRDQCVMQSGMAMCAAVPAYDERVDAVPAVVKRGGILAGGALIISS